MIDLIKGSIQYRQKFSYSGKLEVGPHSTQFPSVLLQPALQLMPFKRILLHFSHNAISHGMETSNWCLGYNMLM